MPSPFSYSLNVPAPTVQQTAATPATPALRDIAIDSVTDELVFADGDLQFVSGKDSIVSDAKARLRFFQGEWFLDLNAGMPYFQSILVKAPNMAVVNAAYRDTLSQTEGVIAVNSLSVDYTPSGRSLQVTFSISTDVGVINQSVQVPVP